MAPIGYQIFLFNRINMRKHQIFNLALGLLTTVLLASCENNLAGLSPHAQIYMPQAVNTPSQHTLVHMDSAQVLVFGAAYGSPDILDETMEVHFEVSPELVDAFNQMRGTDYAMAPEGSYELSGDRASILAGEMQSNALKLWVNPGKGFDFETRYLLPVTIKSVESELPINEDLGTTYFLLEANPPVYEAFDREEWSIYDVSSEEVVGEGAGNGNAYLGQ